MSHADSDQPATPTPDDRYCALQTLLHLSAGLESAQSGVAELIRAIGDPPEGTSPPPPATGLFAGLDGRTVHDFSAVLAELAGYLAVAARVTDDARDLAICLEQDTPGSHDAGSPAAQHAAPVPPE